MKFQAVDLPKTVDCDWAFYTLINLWWFDSDTSRLAERDRDQLSPVVYHINADARALNAMPENPARQMFPVEIDIYVLVLGVAKCFCLCGCFIVVLRTVVTTPDVVLWIREGLFTSSDAFRSLCR